MKTPAEHRVLAEAALDARLDYKPGDAEFRDFVLVAIAHTLAAVSICLDAVPAAIPDDDDDTPLAGRLLTVLADPATPPLGLTVAELSDRVQWTRESVRRVLHELESARRVRISSQRRGASLWCLNGPLPPEDPGIPASRGDRPLRAAIIRELADGDALLVAELALRTNWSVTSVRRELKTMTEAALAVSELTGEGNRWRLTETGKALYQP